MALPSLAAPLPAARLDPSAALRGYVLDLLAAGTELADHSRDLRRQSDVVCARLQAASARLVAAHDHLRRP